ncbi:MAG: hypothetical protein ATN32_07720 [Candidatus Epulonipiscium fishelsonii]|nr:MAG: hypothetical protein ATN32_07720 [Epulopiscium sp. AS2M-Bin002]
MPSFNPSFNPITETFDSSLRLFLASHFKVMKLFSGYGKLQMPCSSSKLICHSIWLFSQSIFIPKTNSISIELSDNPLHPIKLGLDGFPLSSFV